MSDMQPPRHYQIRDCGKTGDWETQQIGARDANGENKSLKLGAKVFISVIINYKIFGRESGL